MDDQRIKKHKQYARYAAYCLGLESGLTPQEHRAINLEMGIEWAKLADDLLAGNNVAEQWLKV